MIIFGDGDQPTLVGLENAIRRGRKRFLAFSGFVGGGNDAPRWLSSKPCLANRERADAQARRPFAALNSNRRTDEKSERKRSHVRVIRAAAALRRHPIDVLRRVLDVARLAVDAILRVDHEPRVRLQLLIGIDHLKDAGGAIEPRRSPYSGKFHPIGIDGSFKCKWQGWSSS